MQEEAPKEEKNGMFSNIFSDEFKSKLKENGNRWVKKGMLYALLIATGYIIATFVPMKNRVV